MLREAVRRLIARQLPKNVTNIRPRLLKLFILILCFWFLLYEQWSEQHASLVCLKVQEEMSAEHQTIQLFSYLTYGTREVRGTSRTSHWYFLHSVMMSVRCQSLRQCWYCPVDNCNVFVMYWRPVCDPWRTWLVGRARTTRDIYLLTPALLSWGTRTRLTQYQVNFINIPVHAKRIYNYKLLPVLHLTITTIRWLLHNSPMFNSD